jgi:hypothetical protein
LPDTSGKSAHKGSDNNLKCFLCRTALTCKQAWFISCTSYMPPFFISVTLYPVCLWWILIFFSTYCTMGTGSFPGVKSGRGVTLTLHLLLVPWSWKNRAIPLLPLWAVRPVRSLSACTRVHFTFSNVHARRPETHNIYQQWPLGNSLGQLVIQLSSTIQILFPVGGGGGGFGAFQIHHVNYQNIW